MDTVTVLERVIANIYSCGGLGWYGNIQKGLPPWGLTKETTKEERADYLEAQRMIAEEEAGAEARAREQERLLFEPLQEQGWLDMDFEITPKAIALILGGAAIVGGLALLLKRSPGAIQAGLLRFTDAVTKGWRWITNAKPELGRRVATELGEAYWARIELGKAMALDKKDWVAYKAYKQMITDLLGRRGPWDLETMPRTAEAQLRLMNRLIEKAEAGPTTFSPQAEQGIVALIGSAAIMGAVAVAKTLTSVYRFWTKGGQEFRWGPEGAEKLPPLLKGLPPLPTGEKQPFVLSIPWVGPTITFQTKEQHAAYLQWRREAVSGETTLPLEKWTAERKWNSIYGETSYAKWHSEYASGKTTLWFPDWIEQGRDED